MRSRALRIVLAVVAAANVACRVPQITGGPSSGGGQQVIDRVALVPGSFTGIVGDTVRLIASACGSRSCQYSYASDSFAWSSSDAAIVMVAGGLVHAVGRGTGYVKATISGKSDSAQIRVGSSYVPLARLSPGGQCALTGSAAAYCWIDTLPPYTFTDFQMFFMSMPYAFAPGVTFTSIASGGGGGCGVAADGQGYCPGVIGGLRFRSLSAGRRDAWSSGPDHWCGVAVDGGAWCWGADDRGQLGVDSTFPTCHWSWGYTYPCSVTPVRVAGGLSFTTISAGGNHSCALTADGTAYCWGANGWGQLGDSSTVSRANPAPVRGAPPLVSLTAGFDHTCGLTSAGAAYCWGRNDTGQLGLGSWDTVPHPVPGLVARRLVFASLDASGATCGLTTEGAAYCWGDWYASPTPVGGSLRFSSIGVWLSPYTDGAFIGGYLRSTNDLVCGIAGNARGYCSPLGEATGSWAPLEGPINP